jgi:carbonic anhydrase
MFSKIKSDIPASIVVFLVALPLCLGVALASGAPLLSGIIAGVIGGIVVGFLSQSHASVSGPAAGLAAVVLTAITQLGSFEIFLLAVVFAGILQLAAGIAKAGFIANYIPSNVIKGLLAAIGIILILKQIPHALGFNSHGLKDFSLFQLNGEFVLSHFSFGAIIISLISILVMANWDKTPMGKVRFLPASLFVVILGILLNAVFINYLPSLAIRTEHLVNIPKFEGVGSLVTLPDFSAFANYHVWIVAFTIAAVASIETLLNLEAVENLDPHKRQASPNRELMAQGIGNILSGLIGGIPITSVIVRSSVNLNAGAATKLSAILHGILLLVSVLLLSPLLNYIPLASLACILLLTGYKLAKISLFKEMFRNGLNQFIPFIATILAIVFTDLLIGVLIGMAISIFYILKNNFKNSYYFHKENFHAGDKISIKLAEEVSFLNKASIKDTLSALPDNSNVTIDASGSAYIDFDVVEILKDFILIQSKEKNITLTVIGFKEKYNIQNEELIQSIHITQ